MAATRIVWFRADLRVHDNPALADAMQGACVPVFVWSPEEESPWPPGSASRWWLKQSLRSLDVELRRLGSRLVLRRGPAARALVDLAAEVHADVVTWNRRPEPAARRQEDTVSQALNAAGVRVAPCAGCWLIDPPTLLAPSTRPYQVFSAYYRAALRSGIDADGCPSPRRLEGPPQAPSSQALEGLGIEATEPSGARWKDTWSPGEASAQEAVTVTATRLSRYAEERDRPGSAATSRLSPHLHFGEISPGFVWRALAGVPGAEPFLRQLMWREFSHYLLYHFPHTDLRPLRTEFDAFPWREDPESVAAWRGGRTGYPLVDAGMRELSATGYMHNRVRMVVASFLTKHMLVPWQEGARWFWERLVDADLANNSMGWQWTAGCGADAAPFYRIFNPTAQGTRFDPEGAYVRRWVPELAQVPNEWVHRPWQAPADVLTAAGLRPGVAYPSPIVDHSMARARALEAYGIVRMLSQGGSSAGRR